jgi:hypothetical protein
VVVCLILLRKIKQTTTHSLFYFNADGGEILLRQPRKGVFGHTAGLWPAMCPSRGQAALAKQITGSFEDGLK